MFGAGLRFDPTRAATASTQGNLSRENLLELAVAGVALVIGYHLWSSSENRRQTECLAFVAPGLFFIASAGWSLSPLLTVGKGISILAYGALAAGSVSAFSAPDRQRLFGEFARLFIRTTAALSCLGIALATKDKNRWTWPGAFPGTAATLTACALILVVLLRADGGKWISRREAVICTLPLVAMHLGAYTRATTASLVLALMFLGYGRVKERHGGRLAMGAMFLSLFSLALAVRLLLPMLESVLDRTHRGEDLTRLNGRRDLWAGIFPRLVADHRLLIGYGYSGSRKPLLGIAAWAGTAHAAPVQVMVDVGVIGFTALLVLLIRSLREVHRAPNSLPSRFIGVYLLLWIPLGFSSDGLVLPGPMSAWLFLAFSCALPETHEGRSIDVKSSRPSRSRDLQPSGYPDLPTRGQTALGAAEL